MMPPPQFSFLTTQAKEQALARFQILEPLSILSNEPDDQPVSYSRQEGYQQSASESDLIDIRFDVSLTLPTQSTTQYQEPHRAKPHFFADEQARLTLGSFSNSVVIGSTLTVATHDTTPVVEAGHAEFPPDAGLMVAFSEFDPGGGGEINKGSIKLYCETNIDWWQDHWLPDNQKQSPGWFSNVNWSDDDNDGWNPATTKTITADPSATYTPDRDDPNLVTGGDRDLRRFVVNVIAPDSLQQYDFSFTITFGSNVRVYLQNTKAGNITTGTKFATGDMTPPVVGNDLVKTKTLWLEGYNASSAFLDTTLKVDYTPTANGGATIPMGGATADEAKVTVFGVNQTGIFSGAQQADDYERMSTYNASLDENGQISWDLPQYLLYESVTGIAACQYFHDCMEMQGVVLPPRDDSHSIYYGIAVDPRFPEYNGTNNSITPLVTFRQYREKYMQGWAKYTDNPDWYQNYGVDKAMQWLPDNGTYGNAPGLNDGEASVPTLDSHIYFMDAPGMDWKARNAAGAVLEYFQRYINFRNRVEISIYGQNFMCSDFSRWHISQLLKPKDNSYMTRASVQLNSPASGWIPIVKRNDTATW